MAGPVPSSWEVDPGRTRAFALRDGVWQLRMPLPWHDVDHVNAYVLERDGTDVALFSGGSLMVGTVGRTDLCGPDLTEQLAHEMFHSLRRFDTLPDSLSVFPTHGTGSFCSGSGATSRTSTTASSRRPRWASSPTCTASTRSAAAPA